MGSIVHPPAGSVGIGLFSFVGLGMGGGGIRALGEILSCCCIEGIAKILGSMKKLAEISVLSDNICLAAEVNAVDV